MCFMLRQVKMSLLRNLFFLWVILLLQLSSWRSLSVWLKGEDRPVWASIGFSCFCQTPKIKKNLKKMLKSEFKKTTELLRHPGGHTPRRTSKTSVADYVSYALWSAKKKKKSITAKQNRRSAHICWIKEGKGFESFLHAGFKVAVHIQCSEWSEPTLYIVLFWNVQ